MTLVVSILAGVLVDGFLATLDEARRDGARQHPELAAALAELTTAAVAGWDPPPVSADDFVAWVAPRIPPGDDDVVAALRALRPADLYLACACARHDPGATATLEARYMPGIRAALRSMRADDASLDEVLQSVREKLLVGDASRGPRIADYAGRGDLRRWLRAAAVRTYLNLRRSARRERLVDDDEVLDEVSTPAGDPELAHMKRLYQAEFKAAFLDAVARLNDQDKNLLRFRHVDRLGVDEIAALYQIHRATAHRWLASARERLGGDTLRALRRRLGVETTELESIRRLVESQVDLSLVRVLGPDDT